MAVATLFLFHNSLTDTPVGPSHYRIHGSADLNIGLMKPISYLGENLAVLSSRWNLDIAHALSILLMFVCT
jgi:hypothetical protein